MVNKTPKELEETRSRIVDGLDNEYWAIDQRREDNKPIYGNYRSCHKSWWSMGNCSLLLGETTRAREEFAASALYVRALQSEFVDRYDDLSKSEQRHIGVGHMWGIYMAVLSGDSRLIDALGNDILNLTDDFATEYGGEWANNGMYWRACTISSLFLQEYDAGREYLKLHREADDDKHTKLLARVHEAMLDGEQQATLDALQALVDSHESVFGESLPWIVALSHATAAHLLVARSQGMEISAADLDNQYVPPAFDEYDIGDTIDLPTPEYVDERLIP